MTVDDPRRGHFTPYRDRYTPVVCTGPKFLASMFVSDPSNDEERRKRRFADRLLALIQNQELPYSRILTNNHVLDEAATRVNYPTLLARHWSSSLLEGGALMWTPGNQAPAIGW